MAFTPVDTAAWEGDALTAANTINDNLGALNGVAGRLIDLRDAVTTLEGQQAANAQALEECRDNLAAAQAAANQANDDLATATTGHGAIQAAHVARGQQIDRLNQYIQDLQRQVTILHGAITDAMTGGRRRRRKSKKSKRKSKKSKRKPKRKSKKAKRKSKKKSRRRRRK